MIQNTQRIEEQENRTWDTFIKEDQKFNLRDFAENNKSNLVMWK